jgi:hypothetical protein
VIVARGYDVVIFVGEQTLRPRGEILHDESGREWPSDEALVMPFRKTGKPIERVPRTARKHFGEGYKPLRGVVDLPSRRTRWQEIGIVDRIEYIRRGDYHDPEGHYHDFGERGAFSFWGKKKPTLYKHGEVLRIAGVTWTWVGAVG